MNPHELFALALDPTLFFQAQGLDADAWQRAFLFSSARQALLNCCRQAGKSAASGHKVLRRHVWAFRW